MKDYEGNLVLDKEDFLRPGTTVEALSELNPSFVGLYDFPMGPEGQQVTCREMVEKTYPDVTVEHIHHAGTHQGLLTARRLFYCRQKIMLMRMG